MSRENRLETFIGLLAPLSSILVCSVCITHNMAQALNWHYLTTFTVDWCSLTPSLVHNINTYSLLATMKGSHIPFIDARATASRPADTLLGISPCGSHLVTATAGVAMIHWLCESSQVGGEGLGAYTTTAPPERLVSGWCRATLKTVATMTGRYLNIYQKAVGCGQTLWGGGDRECTDPNELPLLIEVE